MKLMPKYQTGGKQDSIKDYRPKLLPAVERTVNGKKWRDLNPKERFMNRRGYQNGRPTEQGLEIVSPEFDLISGIRGITNMLPKTQTFYHGSPARFNKFDTQFIGSGEGGSKAMKGINLWPEDRFGAAPKFANIRSKDAPLHFGKASKEVAGELNPTVYKVRGKNLNIYKGNSSKGLDQQNLVDLGYDGFSNNTQYTIFPESVNKLKIKKQYSIPEFIKANHKTDSWAPWSTDTNKMNNIFKEAGVSQRFTTPTNISKDLDNAYFSAIKNNDIKEAQRLRDLHYTQSAPNSHLKQRYYRTERDNTVFNEYDPKLFGKYGERIGRGIYLLDDKQAALNYGSNVREFFVNSKNLVEDLPGPKLFGSSDNIINIMSKDTSPLLKKAAENVRGADAIHGVDTSWGSPLNEYVVKSSNQIKLTNPITYDNTGNIIPLSKRDNWSNPDIRYGIAGLLGIGTLSNK